MNDPRDESEPTADATAVPTPAQGDAAAAPKRRRARAADAGDGGDAPAAAADDAPPKRRARRPAAAADEAEADTAAPTLAEPVAELGAEPAAAAAVDAAAAPERKPRARRPRPAAAPDAPATAPAVAEAVHVVAHPAAPLEPRQGVLPLEPSFSAVAQVLHPAGAGASRGADEADEADEADGRDDAASFGAPAAPVADVAQRFEDVISGQYDEEAPATEAEAAEVTKRVLRPEPEAPKLHKVLAQAGIGSRRDMEALIEEGQVTVNGEPAHLGMRITHGDQIAVAGKPVKVRIAPGAARVLAYHKPVGEVVTHHDPEGRPTVFRRLPRLNRGKWLSVGRLDLNTEGLLLFTNSGDLANQLMHPRFGVEREYAVRVLGELSAEAREQLLAGVDIDGQKASFKSIEDGGGVGANHWWRVVISEGRNREVRKLFDAVGLTVSRLIRIRYGTVVLPRGLKRGVWVELDDNDVRQIRRLAGPEPRRQNGPSGPEGTGPREAGPAGQGGAGDRDRRGRRNKPRRNGPGQGAPEGRAQGNAYGQPQRGPAPGPNAGAQNRGPQQGPARQRERERPPAAYDEHREADDPLHIPNPLEQTFDRRFASGSKRIAAGFGRPGDESHRGPAQRKGSGPREPDPMQTSVGYIGADAFFHKPGGGGPKRGRRR